MPYVEYVPLALPERRLDSPDLSRQLQLVVGRSIGGLIVRQSTTYQVERALREASIRSQFLGEILFNSRDGGLPMHADKNNSLVTLKGTTQLDVHSTSAGKVGVRLIPVADSALHLPGLNPKTRRWEFDEDQLRALELGTIDVDMCRPECYSGTINAGDSLVFLDSQTFHEFESFPDKPRLSTASIYGVALTDDFRLTA